MIYVLVGGQWGDEGKGKVVDALDADGAARFFGGANAGHTVIVNDAVFVAHLLPSTIMNPDKKSFMTRGMVYDPEKGDEEIQNFRTHGVSITPKNLLIDKYISITFPHHKLLDWLEDWINNIGTTGSGIGPTYSDKFRRTDYQMQFIADKEYMTDYFITRGPKINNDLEFYIDYVKGLDLSPVKDAAKFAKREKWFKETLPRYYDNGLNIDEIIDNISALGERIAPFICDATEEILRDLAQGKTIIAEGAQSLGLDVLHNTTMDKTSSLCGYAGALAGMDIGPQHVSDVTAVAKLIQSRVGEGPLIGEFGTYDDVKADKNHPDAQEIERLVKQYNEGALSEAQKSRLFRNYAGREIGATSGRNRRVSRFDLVFLKKNCEANGIRNLALTKLDVYSGLNEFEVTTSYDYSDGETRPVYTTFKGYGPVRGIRTFKALPKEAKEFINRINEFMGIPVKYVSTGPNREDLIVIN